MMTMKIWSHSINNGQAFGLAFILGGWSMWVLLGGRLAKSIAAEVSKVSGEMITGVEYVDDVLFTLETRGKDAFTEVKGFIVLDTSLSTLKNWDVVRKLANEHMNKPVHVVSRFPELTPSSDSFGSNVVVEATNKVTVDGLAYLMKADAAQVS
ncbi:hypothetical protein FTV55_09670 [Bacillus paranthracis]|nr:hypothetical protein [Bacillus paranthracis]